MKDRLLELAIVGIGKWGQNLVREFSALARTYPDFHLTTIVGGGSQTNLSRITQLNPKLSFEPDYKKILADPSIGAVVIATPIVTHEALTRLALEADKHVFVEKPPTQNRADLEQLAILAEQKGLVYFTDNTLLYHPIFQKLQEQLRGQTLIKGKFEWRKWGSFEEDIFENLAYHYLYIALSIFGKPNQVSLTRKSENIAEFKFLYPENVECTFIIDRLYRGSDRVMKSLEFITKTGGFKWEQDRDLYLLTTDGDKSDLLLREKRQPLPLVCRDFIERIRNGNTTVANLDLMLETLEIIEKLRN